MFPSCEGRFVIFAFPNSVSMIAPLIRTFCLARKVLAGVSITFLIVDFLDFPFTITFAILLRKETSFVVLPLPISSFVFRSPIFTILVWPCLLANFFFFGLLYRAPDVFLPAFMTWKENFGLNRLWLSSWI